MRGINAWGRAAVLVLGLGPACALAFPDGAPVAHTGGFGEPHCESCHLGGDPPVDSTGLWLKNLGDTYEPGRTYEFLLHLIDPGKVVAGFQMSVRFIDAPSQSAGRLQTDDELRVIEKDGVQYLGHQEARRHNSDDNDFRWQIRWTAPQTTSAADVVFHVAAVAGNDDESPLGDTVHILTHWLQPD